MWTIYKLWKTNKHTILKLWTLIKNIIETQSTHKFPYNILFTFLMDRGRAPNGIGHLMILIRRDLKVKVGWTCRSNRSVTTSDTYKTSMNNRRIRLFFIDNAPYFSRLVTLYGVMDVASDCITGKTRALSYYSDLTLSQEFQPMAAQLSLKAALPLAKIRATTSCRSSKTGPTEPILPNPPEHISVKVITLVGTCYIFHSVWLLATL